MSVTPSYEAYKKAHKRAATPRDAEYAAFTEATRRLMAAEDIDGDPRERDLKNIGEALHMNRMLWGALADDCAQESNTLPPQTRAQIISLARWVASHSGAVLRGKQEIAPLIEINRMIMKGLAGQTEDQTDHERA